MEDGDLSYEPMDVDVSINSVSKMDISCDSQDGRYLPKIIKTEKVDPGYESPIPNQLESTPFKTIQFKKKKKRYIKTEKVDPGYESPIPNQLESAPIKNIQLIIKTEKVDPGYESPIPNQFESTPFKTIQFKKKKKRYIKINRDTKEKKLFYFKCLLSGLLVLFLALVVNNTLYGTCSEKLDLEYIKERLYNEVYGQNKAMQDIVDALSSSESKILFFYGGTGVGKTYASSIILNKHWTSSNVYHYTMPSFGNTFSTEFLFGLTFCKSSILVVDDLSLNDMNIMKSIIPKLVQKAENLSKNITIMLIYNCDNVSDSFTHKCDTMFPDTLKESFKDIKVVKKFIEFKKLTKKHLLMCIEKELKDTKLNKIELENLLKNFNVAQDGCKGVHTKIKLLNIL